MFWLDSCICAWTFNELNVFASRSTCQQRSEGARFQPWSDTAFSFKRLVSTMSTINKWWLLKQQTELTAYSFTGCVSQPGCPRSCLHVSIHIHKSCSPECTCVWKCERSHAENRTRLMLSGCDWSRQAVFAVSGELRWSADSVQKWV